MKSFTFLGNKSFYLFVLPAVYWFWKGEKIPFVLILLFGLYVNHLLKLSFHLPRPEGVALIDADGFGFPSGHAMGAMILWGYFSWTTKRNYWIYGTIIFFVGLSRIYLGVHFPSDVMGGWSIGFAWLAGCMYLKSELEKKQFSIQPVPAVGLILMITLWMAFFTPDNLSLSIAGVLLGLVAGGVSERYMVKYNPSTEVWKQVVKVFLGLAGLAVINYAIKEYLPANDALRYMRYACAGVWISFGALWVFKKFKLI
tara:strand:+ start:847 stop:1611 length:765 start_codon:yes stop_codon:yes gene_type:complete